MQQVQARQVREGQLFHWSYEAVVLHSMGNERALRVQLVEPNHEVPGNVIITYGVESQVPSRPLTTAGSYECRETDLVYILPKPCAMGTCPPTGCQIGTARGCVGTPLDDRIYSADPTIDAQFRARAAAAEVEMQRVVRAVMRYYFDCITWDYTCLTPEEQELMTREQFAALQAYCQQA